MRIGIGIEDTFEGTFWMGKITKENRSRLKPFQNIIVIGIRKISIKVNGSLSVKGFPNRMEPVIEDIFITLEAI